MSKSLPVTAATATEVRDLVASLVISGEVALSAAAYHNLTSRGRLHPEVVAAHNSRVSHARRYVEGAVRTVPLTYKRVTASGARKSVTMLPESEIRDLARRAGATVGKRGPLNKAAFEAAAVQFEADRQEALTV